MNHHAEPLEVLVVARGDDARTTLLESLGDLGCRVTVTDGLAGAIDACRKVEYALTVVDCQLSEARGDQIARALRQAPDGRPPRVVVGYTAGSVVACHDRPCGMAEVLRKPAAQQELLALVDRVARGDVAALRSRTQEGVATGTLGRCPNTTASQSLKDMDPEIARQLLEVFLEDAESRMARIATLIDMGEHGAARRQVHALKSGCLQVGAEAMVRNCDALVTALERGDLVRARMAFDDLGAAFAMEH